MLNFRKIALLATLATTVALPALAQTPAQDAPAPAAQTEAAPVPDTGIKPTQDAPKPHHKHHRHMHKASLRHRVKETAPVMQPTPETTPSAPQN